MANYAARFFLYNGRVIFDNQTNINRGVKVRIDESRRIYHICSPWVGPWIKKEDFFLNPWVGRRLVSLVFFL